MVISIIGLIILMIIIPVLVCFQFNNKEVMSIKESLDLTRLPIITFEHNGNKLNFLLDTGSTESHICKSASNKLTGSINEAKYSFTAANGGGNNVNNEINTTLHYKKSEFKTTLLINKMLDISFEDVRKNTGVILHGILGSDFLTQHKYILDFAKQIVYHK